MAFSDPQTITVNAIAISLPRVASPVVNAGKFASNDGNTSMTIQSTSNGKRTRRSYRFDFAKVAADPLISAQNIRYTNSMYLVVDQPITGFTVAELKLQLDGMLAHLSASSGAKLTQFLGGEV
jgi:hypothetical protein